MDTVVTAQWFFRKCQSDVYIIISHVIYYCPRLVTEPTKEFLCVGPLCLLTVADFLHLSHFGAIEEAIDTSGVTF